ncbi:MAG: MSH system minor pilin protein MshC [Idiomarinaceae bacterium HL-53]|nr:MAG: MSH system minor pilin protein MshC [Idiomarinaceae bacterium HL-53]
MFGSIKGRDSGFTLVELIIVIIILGLLAVTAAPRFLTPQNVQPSLVLSELETLLTELQAKALNDTVEDNCYGLSISSNTLIRENCRTTSNAVDLKGVTIAFTSDGSPATLPLYFNSVGCLGTCGNKIEIRLDDNDSTSICVHEQGYIQKSPC